jgi:hypothetical protein
VLPEELHVPDRFPPDRVPLHGPTLLELKLSDPPETWPVKELPSLQLMAIEHPVWVIVQVVVSQPVTL